MKRKSLIAAIVLASSPAIANEPAKPFNWTGAYFGVGLGVVVDAGSDVTYAAGGNFEAADTTKALDMPRELIGSAHVGYLFQIGQFVAGPEASFSVGALNAKLNENPPPAGNDYQTKSNLGPLVMAGGRLGFAADRFMVYGKAGYAWASTDFSASFYNKDGIGGTNGTRVGISKSFDLEAPYFGAGIEYAIASNFTVGVEYVRVDFGSTGIATLDTTNSGITTEQVKTSNTLDTVSVRFNYKF